MAKQKTEPSGFEELKEAIRRKKPGRLYFFHGEETFLMEHYLDAMKRLLLDELTESFNYHRLNEETFDIRGFADGVESLPMMAEHTLVRVDDVDLFKLPESDREKMIDILSDIPEHCTVVFVYLTAPWKPDKRLKKLWEVVSKYGAQVEFRKQPPGHRPPHRQGHDGAAGGRRKRR